MGENLIPKTKKKLSRTVFLEKYDRLALYDEDYKKIFIIDNEGLQFDKKIGWTLIEIPDEHNGLIFDHEYFCIHEDLFDRT